MDFFTAIQAQTETKVTKPAVLGNTVHALNKLNPNAVIKDGKIKLFVYGTLKQGNLRNSVLSGGKYICDAYLTSEYCLKQTSAFPGIISNATGFPVLLLKKESTPNETVAVRGEIYEVDHSTFRTIDHIEQLGIMYSKSIVSAFRPSDDDPRVKEMYRCYTYIGIPEYWEKTVLYPSPISNLPIPHYIFNPYATNNRSNSNVC